MSRLNKTLIIISSLFLIGCTFDGTGLGTDGNVTSTGNGTESSERETSIPDLGHDTEDASSSTTVNETTLGESTTSIGTATGLTTSSSLTTEPIDSASSTGPVESTGLDAYCGNGVVDENEECDDFGKDTEYCTKYCTISKCGDGYVNFFKLEECDDGNEDDNDLCNNNCILNRRCWVSETALPGNMGGLQIADNLCKEEASFWNIPAPVKALMGDSKNSPKDRLGSENFKGNYVCEFEDKFDLLHPGWFEYSVKNLFSCTASKKRIPASDIFVWTFFENFGELGKGSNHCGDWKEAGERDNGMFGNPNTIGYWRQFNNTVCLNENRIYCCQSESL